MTAYTTNSALRTVVSLTGTIVFASICLLGATAPAQAASPVQFTTQTAR
jgi:hypothetical protein